MAGLTEIGWLSCQATVAILSSLSGWGLGATSSGLSSLGGSAPYLGSRLLLQAHLNPILAVCALSGVGSQGNTNTMAIATTDKQGKQTSLS